MKAGRSQSTMYAADSNEQQASPSQPWSLPSGAHLSLQRNMSGISPAPSNKQCDVSGSQSTRKTAATIVFNRLT